MSKFNIFSSNEQRMKNLNLKIFNIIIKYKKNMYMYIYENIFQIYVVLFGTY